MHNVNIGSMFGRVEFAKPGREIAEKAKAKSEAVREKIEERQGRIARIREEYGITDAVLADVLAQAMHRRGQTYSVSNAPVGRDGSGQVTVPAGVITNLTTEQEYIEEERQQVARLDLLARNIAPDASHKLTFDEMEYLGF